MKTHPLDGETVTLVRVTCKLMANRWQGGITFMNPDTGKSIERNIDIWGDQATLLKRAGYTLPKAGHSDVNIDVVLEHLDHRNSLRITGVYKPTGGILKLADIGRDNKTAEQMRLEAVARLQASGNGGAISGSLQPDNVIALPQRKWGFPVVEIPNPYAHIVWGFPKVVTYEELEKVA